MNQNKALCLLAAGCFAYTASAVRSAELQHLTLAAAQELFTAHSHELAAARQAVEASAADRIAAAQLPNPTLSTGVSAINPRTGIGSGTLRDKQVDSVIAITQLFERGNKRQLRTEAAEHTLQAVRNDAADGLRQQTLALKSAFFDLALAQERLRVSEDTAQLMRRSVEAAQLRAKRGDIAPADVARLRVEASRAENDLRQAQGDREKAQVTLAYFIGVQAQASHVVVEPQWPDPDALPPAAPADRVIESRADVLAATGRVNAAQKNRDLARASRAHDVTLGLQYEHFPGDTTNNTYGITVSIPLFTFYQFQGEIKKAQSGVAAAEEDLARVRDVARGELLKAQADLTSAAERLRRYIQSLLHDAQTAADAVEYAYKRGAVGVTDLLDARRTLYATRLDAATAHADFAKALAAWQAAVQPANP